MEKSIRPFMVILIILLSVVVSSGATYLFVDNETSKEESNLQSQINSLESQLSILKNSSAIVDETADWKTYTNTKYGFSFKYPKNITLSETDRSELLKVTFDLNSITFTMQVPQFEGGIHGVSTENIETKLIKLKNSATYKRQIFQPESQGGNYAYIATQDPRVDNDSKSATLSGYFSTRTDELIAQLDNIVSSINFSN